MITIAVATTIINQDKPQCCTNGVKAIDLTATDLLFGQGRLDPARFAWLHQNVALCTPAIQDLLGRLKFRRMQSEGFQRCVHQFRAC